MIVTIMCCNHVIIKTKILKQYFLMLTPNGLCHLTASHLWFHKLCHCPLPVTPGRCPVMAHGGLTLNTSLVRSRND